MTCKAIYCFSLTGNTKSLVDTLDDLHGWDIFNLNKMKPEEVAFDGYTTILIGTLTLGGGVPPLFFKKIAKQLLAIKNAKIGLFGSGQSHYEHFCGALDVLEDVLKPKNEICFKLKFESYPTAYVKEEFNQLVREITNENHKV